MFLRKQQGFVTVEFDQKTFTLLIEKKRVADYSGFTTSKVLRVTNEFNSGTYFHVLPLFHTVLTEENI